ncbi:MAG: EAL domain-containing protein [Halanaerobium sp.]
MKNVSFRNKILALILTIIVIFTLTIIIAITNSFNWILEDIIFENEINNVAQKSELTANWFEEKKSDLEIYANTQVVQHGSWRAKLDYLQTELQKRDNNYFFFFIADQKGDYSTTEISDAGNIKDRKYFEQVLKGETVISNPIISKSTGAPIIVIASPIAGDNLSLLGATMEIKKLSNYINRYTNNQEGIYSFLINDQGNIVAHPEMSNTNSHLFYNYSSFFNYEYSFIDNIKNQNQGNLTFSENEKEKHAFYQSIPGTNGWKIVSVLPQSYLQQSIDQVNNIIVIISIITILIAVILSFFLSNNIAKPIIQLKNTFQKGASGNLNIRSEIDSNDEIGEAAASFNQMMEVIKDLSYNDSLTGLPNINYFKKELQNYLDSEESKKFYLCAVGIDDFKSINDSFGHDIGDQILQKLANRLTNQIKENQLISRVGDEFYFYLEKSEVETKKTLQNKLNKVLNNINSNYFINENLIHLKSSMGVSIYPDDSKKVNRLLKNASLAMHAVKKNSSDKMAFYSLNIDRSVSEKKKLENQLAAALKNEEFILHYQSFNNGQNEKIVGFEALIRWQHPKKGLISPGFFIPLAEENGFIKDIGAWVLEKSCREIKELNDQFGSDYYLSVNVSPEQFIAQDFINTVKKALQKSGLKAQNLELEITERTTVENIDYTIELLEQLNQLGIRTSIDDFGTGYSSLNYIKKFAINTLKIDKSFVDDFLQNINNRAIVNTIITLAHNLNLKVVAEGVETKEQAEQLKNFGCDIIQGYYYSHPVPLQELIFKLKTIENN